MTPAAAATSTNWPAGTATCALQPIGGLASIPAGACHSSAIKSDNGAKDVASLANSRVLSASGTPTSVWVSAIAASANPASANPASVVAESVSTTVMCAPIAALKLPPAWAASPSAPSTARGGWSGRGATASWCWVSGVPPSTVAAGPAAEAQAIKQPAMATAKHRFTAAPGSRMASSARPLGPRALTVRNRLHSPRQAVKPIETATLHVSDNCDMKMSAPGRGVDTNAVVKLLCRQYLHLCLFVSVYVVMWLVATSTALRAPPRFPTAPRGSPASVPVLPNSGSLRHGAYSSRPASTSPSACRLGRDAAACPVQVTRSAQIAWLSAPTSPRNPKPNCRWSKKLAGKRAATC